MGRRKLPEKALPAPPQLFLARSPWASTQDRRPHFQSGHYPSLPLRGPSLPQAIGCLCLSGAPQNGRRSPPPAPSGLDGAQQQPPPQPGLGRGCPGLGTSQSLGKAVREPRPFTQPAGPLATPQPPLTSRRRCCRPEPRRAVIKAMLLEGVLAATGPARTVLEMTLARVGGDGLPGPAVTRAPSVSGHTGETSGPLSPAPATLPPYLPEEPPGSLAGPRAGPGAHGGRSGFRSGRSYCPSSGSRDGGLPGGGELCSRASRGAGASRESSVHQAGGEPVPAQPAALRSPLFRGTHIP